MSVFRVVKNKDFTVMSNHHLTNKNLSLKAKGLLSVMLSLPDSWDYSINGLASLCAEGKAAIQTALVELEKEGYVVREQQHAANGTFAGFDYVIYEHPQTFEPYTENRDTVNEREADAPYTDFPLTDNPSTENQPQVNTNIANTKYIPPIVPQKGTSARGKQSKTIPKWKPERFERFWKYYRDNARGENRAGAVKEWDSLKPSDELIAIMGQALKRQVLSQDWQRGIGIPHAVRWLKNRRWEDEGVHTAEENREESQGVSWDTDREVIDYV